MRVVAAWDFPAEAPPEINRIVKELIAGPAAALDRARDHIRDPKKVPLPADKKALEHKLAATLAGLERKLRKPAKGAAGKPVSARRADARNPSPGKRKKASLSPAVVAALERIRAGSLADLQPTAAPLALLSPFVGLEQIHCIEDTLELGKDDIILGAVVSTVRVLDDGILDVQAKIIEAKDIGKFRQEDVKDFDPPLNVANFAPTETPATFLVTLVMAEEDLIGGINAVLRDLLDGIKNSLNGHRITAILGGAAGIATIAALIADFAAIYPLAAATVVASIAAGGIVAVIAFAVAELLLLVIKMFRDDVFPAQNTAITLDAAGDLESGTLEVFEKRFERAVGIYEASLRWQIA